jgi:hypothetical protein
MTKRDDDREPKADAKRPKSAAPPPLVGRIADVEPFQAPFQPPPGSLKPPDRGAPVWHAAGTDTGQLVAPSAPLPKTVELEMPPAPEYPETRELALPDAPAPMLFAETTYVLEDAQLRGDKAAPLAGDAPPPLEGEKTEPRFEIPEGFFTLPIDQTHGDEDSGSQSLFALHEETTNILKDRIPGPDGDGEK